MERTAFQVPFVASLLGSLATFVALPGGGPSARPSSTRPCRRSEVYRKRAEIETSLMVKNLYRNTARDGDEDG